MRFMLAIDQSLSKLMLILLNYSYIDAIILSNLKNTWHLINNDIKLVYLSLKSFEI